MTMRRPHIPHRVSSSAAILIRADSAAPVPAKAEYRAFAANASQRFGAGRPEEFAETLDQGLGAIDADSRALTSRSHA